MSERENATQRQLKSHKLQERKVLPEHFWSHNRHEQKQSEWYKHLSTLLEGFLSNQIWGPLHPINYWINIWCTFYFLNIFQNQIKNKYKRVNILIVIFKTINNISAGVDVHA